MPSSTATGESEARTADPCGTNIDGTPLLAALDAYGVFGRSASLDVEPPSSQRPRGWKPFDWPGVQAAATAALAVSRDLRVLAHLGAARLRIEGLPAFCETVVTAHEWLARDWDAVYPRIEDDGLARQNALNNFADPFAVIDTIRRMPLARSRTFGTWSLRQIEIATNILPAPAGETKVPEEQIADAFGDMGADEIATLRDGVTAALAALRALDDLMVSRCGVETMLSVQGLVTQLNGISAALHRFVPAPVPDEATGPEAIAAAVTTVSPAAMPAVVTTHGPIVSRESAIVALEAVTEYFRRHEPSSPIPLLLERATGLVAKDFLDVLADIAPDAVEQARTLRGSRSKS